MTSLSYLLGISIFRKPINSKNLFEKERKGKRKRSMFYNGDTDLELKILLKSCTKFLFYKILFIKMYYKITVR